MDRYAPPVRSGSRADPTTSPRSSRRPALLAVVLVSAMIAAASVSCSSSVDVGVDGVTARWVDVGGPHQRRALLVTPDRALSATAVARRPPLIVVLHGLGQDPEQMLPFGNWPQVSKELGAVVVFGDGWNDSWNAGTCCGDAASTGVDDVAYLNRTILVAIDETDADPDSVYMVGFSNGAMMTYRYLCEGGIRLRGAASVAGTNASGCSPTRPTNFIQISGTADTTVPIRGASSAVATLGELVPVTDAVAGVATAFSCPTPDVQRSAQVISRSWSPCADGVSVRFDQVVDFGHFYPMVDGYPATLRILSEWGLGSGA